MTTIGSYSNPYPNPGPFRVHDGKITFSRSKRTFSLTSRMVSSAARYLSHDVKMAENRGKRVPKGPYGMSPGEAGFILYHGKAHLRAKPKKRPAKCPPCKAPAKKRAKKAVASKPVTKTVRDEYPATIRDEEATVRTEQADTLDYISSVASVRG